MKADVGEAERCCGPACSRGVRADGLCATHYQQQRRGCALRPIGGNGPRVRLPGVLVSPACAAALEKTGPTTYAAVRAVLEWWAAPRTKGK